MDACQISALLNNILDYGLDILLLGGSGTLLTTYGYLVLPYILGFWMPGFLVPGQILAACLILLGGCLGLERLPLAGTPRRNNAFLASDSAGCHRWSASYMGFRLGAVPATL